MSSLHKKYGLGFSSEITKDLADSLEMAHVEIEKLKKYWNAKFESEASLEKRVSALEKDLHEIKDYAAELKDYILQLDTSPRKKNLIITGLSEMKGETSDFLTLKILNFLKPYVSTLEMSDIYCAYRLGKKTGKSRPIVCKFLCEKTRNNICSIRNELGDD